MCMKSTITIGALLWGVVSAIPATGQQYDARRDGDIVHLEDRTKQIVVRAQAWGRDYNVAR